MKTIEERANDTLVKRIRGSFGYRGAESVVNGYNPEENLCVYKAHGGTRDDLERSLQLVIDRSEPQVSAKDIADDLSVDTGEADEILNEEKRRHEELVEKQTEYLSTLQTAYDKAPDSYTTLSQFSIDNVHRIMDNLVRNARAQYARSKNAEWANAITTVCHDMREKLVAATPSKEDSDEVAA